MKITLCDNCEEVLLTEKNEIEFHFPTIFTITEKPGQGPYAHSMSIGQNEKNLVRHFCSKRCISQYYAEFDDLCLCGTHKKGTHCNNLPEVMKKLEKRQNISIRNEEDVRKVAKELHHLIDKKGGA